MKLNNKVYDVLKWIAQIVLPALATLYFTLAGIWGFPYAEEIVGTIVAIDTFLGVLLGISTYNYNKLQVNGGTNNEMIGYDMPIMDKNNAINEITMDDKVDESNEFND